MKLTFTLLTALLLTPLTLLHAADAPKRSPNVVLTLADDLGWTDVACFGSDLYETPHLDQLARQGMRFTQAYSATLAALRDSPGCIGYHLCGAYLRNTTRNRALRAADETPDTSALAAITAANREAADWMKTRE